MKANSFSSFCYREPEGVGIKWKGGKKEEIHIHNFFFKVTFTQIKAKIYWFYKWLFIYMLLMKKREGKKEEKTNILKFS